MDDQADSDLILAFVRCSLRMVQTPDNALGFSESGGVAWLCNVILQLVSLAVARKASRVLLFVWEPLGVDKAIIGGAVVAMCGALSEEPSRGNLRLQQTGISLCGYIAAEGVFANVLLTKGFLQVLSNALCRQGRPIEKAYRCAGDVDSATAV
eukprot:GHVS01000645.1.p1 GENE.GHVS01000645.1~~GHVS01000645.1.p1  ORF type:complete len:153 (-),score=21.43 GHVS01000645.1:497-955(-)